MRAARSRSEAAAASDSSPSSRYASTTDSAATSSGSTSGRRRRARASRVAAHTAPAGASARPASATGAPATAATAAAPTAPAAPAPSGTRWLIGGSVPGSPGSASTVVAARGRATTVRSSAPRYGVPSRHRALASSPAAARASMSRLMAAKRSAARRRERAQLRVHVRRAGLDLAVVGGCEQVQVAADEALVVGGAAHQLRGRRRRRPSWRRACAGPRGRAAASARATGGPRRRWRPPEVDEHVHRRAVPALAEQRAGPDQHAGGAADQQPRGQLDPRARHPLGARRAQRDQHAVGLGRPLRHLEAPLGLAPQRGQQHLGVAGRRSAGRGRTRAAAAAAPCAGRRTARRPRCAPCRPPGRARRSARRRAAPRPSRRRTAPAPAARRRGSRSRRPRTSTRPIALACEPVSSRSTSDGAAADPLAA